MSTILRCTSKIFYAIGNNEPFAVKNVLLYKIRLKELTNKHSFQLKRLYFMWLPLEVFKVSIGEK